MKVTVVRAMVVAVVVSTAIGLAGWSVAAQQDQEAFEKAFIGERPAYSEVVVVRTGQTRTIYIAGTTAPGDDLATQMAGAYQGLLKHLEQAGAKPQDIVQTTAFVVNYKPGDYAIWQEAVKKVLPAPHLPAATLVGVSALAVPRLLFEVQAIAVARD